MNRFFQIFNFVGILALATLCCIQWFINTVDAKAIDDLKEVTAQQSAKIADQGNTIKDDAANLDDLRQQLTTAVNDLKDTQTKLTAIITERDRLTIERDHLKADMDEWAIAVAARDDTIKQAAAQIQKLLTDRNNAVAKFNDLVGKYNQLVKDTNGNKPKS
jgi:regulator of replication initiation timing